MIPHKQLLPVNTFNLPFAVLSPVVTINVVSSWRSPLSTAIQILASFPPGTEYESCSNPMTTSVIFNVEHMTL